MARYILSSLFLLFGTLSLGGGLLGWNWLFNAQNGAALVRFLGRRGARIFYTLLGCFTLVMATILLLDDSL